jgi:hypothetical protein
VYSKAVAPALQSSLDGAMAPNPSCQRVRKLSFP